MRIYILVIWFVLVVGSKAIAGPLIDAAKNGNVELV